MILIDFSRDGKIVYVMEFGWAEALVFDTNRGMGYKQDISNTTMGSFPDPRIGANAILGQYRFVICEYNIMLILLLFQHLIIRQYTTLEAST